MSDWQRDTRADYERKGFASRSGYGRNPAFVMVDFINGFTDPSTPLGGDFAWEINATRQLQEAFRRARLPIVYTTSPSAETCVTRRVREESAVARDPADTARRSSRSTANTPLAPGERVLRKSTPAPFSAPSLDLHCGRTASIPSSWRAARPAAASAPRRSNSLQYGYHTIVVREAVGDRARGTARGKPLRYRCQIRRCRATCGRARLSRRSFTGSVDFAAKAQHDFDRWWPPRNAAEHRSASKSIGKQDGRHAGKYAPPATIVGLRRHADQSKRQFDDLYRGGLRARAGRPRRQDRLPLARRTTARHAAGSLPCQRRSDLPAAPDERAFRR